MLIYKASQLRDYNEIYDNPYFVYKEYPYETSIIHNDIGDKLRCRLNRDRIRNNYSFQRLHFDHYNYHLLYIVYWSKG